MKEHALKEQGLVQIALYAALIAALGLIPPVPFLSGIPITAQSLGVMLAGVMLGPLRGFLAVVLLLFVVALGAPLLAGGRGGLAVFVGPTAGFAIGWAFAALATGWVTQQLQRLNLAVAAGIGAFVGGILVLYVFGILGFMLITDNGLLRSTQIMMVYIPGDLVKVVITGLVAQAVYKGLPGAVATRVV
ncbi:BioY family transporter [Saccharospirillum sp. MSK14-1]|uniref:biotin transporter BioY n=1 Tax=Saccharospirillum sp. MSK14-1 TaxID=1897632 RepID=UPI000D3C696E|nr:biotin transporter BioY [Saccharospirillum sp. MSK14-1]PTY37199.1 BioY family transporter [Saccharospirillum sp. MSK14-1]